MPAFFITFDSKHALKHRVIGVVAETEDDARIAARAEVGECFKAVLPAFSPMLPIELYLKQYACTMLYSFMVLKDHHDRPMHEEISNNLYAQFIEAALQESKKEK